MSEAQEWIDGFLVVGNHPALDLLNTALVSDGAPVELLPDTVALERWLLASGLVTSPGLKTSLRSWRASKEAGLFLLELRAFRERLRTAVVKLENGKTPGTEFLTEVNGLLRNYPTRWQVVKKKGGYEQHQIFEPSLPANLWALLAAETMTLLLAVPSSRLRQCEGCVVHFHDISKKGSRRWCSMNLCGNRVKVAAYQKRQRAT